MSPVSRSLFNTSKLSKAATWLAVLAAVIAPQTFQPVSPAAASTTTISDAGNNCQIDVTSETVTVDSSSVSVSLVGTRCVVKFLTAGSYSVTMPEGAVALDYLVVGAGGGGGSGGGGAGGVLQGTNYEIDAANNYVVSVGAGGQGGSGGSGGAPIDATNGENSTFGSLTALGGGHGGQGNLHAGDGGSGGGSQYDCTSVECAGSGTPGQGTDGAPSTHPSYGGGAGGGGAGGSGGNTVLSHIGGNGGDGVVSSITGTSTWYGGGGGGGINSNDSQYCGLNYPGTSDENYYCSESPVTTGGGDGGLGGGGKGSSWGFTGGNYGELANGTPGEPNTGGGGGGTDPEDAYAYAGGSGIVVLSYVSSSSFRKITLDSNNNSGATAVQNVEMGVEVALQGNPFSYEGHVFQGWNTQADGNGTSYENLAKITTSSAFTLYAQWLVGVNHTVTFDANGGTGNQDSQVAGLPTALNSNEFVKPGYTFTGWDTTPSGYGYSYVNNGVYAFDFDVTLFAQWSTDKALHSVNFYGNGATSGTTSSQLASSTQELNENGFQRTGYNFLGWNRYDWASWPEYIDLQNYSFEEDLSLYAIWVPQYQNTVYFDGNGATSGYMPNQDATSKTLLEANGFDRDGYTFLNWNTAPDGSGVNYRSTYRYNFAQSVVLYAIWGANFTVSYDGNGNTGGSAPIAQSSYVGAATLNLEGNSRKLEKSEYLLVGWNTAPDGTGTRYALGQTKASISEDVTLYAQWVADQITVTYSYDGADGGNEVESELYFFGESGLILPTPTKTGYTFKGWYAESDLSFQVGIGGASYTPPSDSLTNTVYAKWVEKTDGPEQQTLEIFGGIIDARHPINSPDPYTETSTDGGLTWHPAYLVGNTHPWGTLAGTNSWLNCGPSFFQCTQTRSDYRYRFYLAPGWSASNLTANMIMDNYGWVSLNGTDISGYQEGGWNSNGAIPVDEITHTGWNTLYVVLVDERGWAGINFHLSFNVTSPNPIKVMVPGTPNTLKVKFNLQGGPGTYATQTYTLGGDPLDIPTPTFAGHTFMGWAKGSTHGSVIQPGSYTPDDNVTLYALWNAPSHTASFISNGGSAVAAVLFDDDGGAVAKPKSPTRAGYTFLGWSDTDGGSAVSFPYTPGVTTDISLYALWSADSHTVTYDSKSGSAVADGTFVTDGSLAIPYDPTLAGYSFLGWSDTEGGEPLSFPYSPGVTTDITLYALWSADSHTVTFDSKQGSAVSASSFVTDGHVAAISAPTRRGFNFQGWSATDGGSAVTFPYSPGVTTDITLYALWAAKPAGDQGPMILEETTTYGNQQAFVPLQGIVRNISIDWGDGTIDGPYSNEIWATHNYSTPGTYTVKVYGTELTRYGACCRWNETLTKVVSFGSLGITDLQYAFAYAPNLQSVPATLPEGVTNLSGAFYYSYKFNQDLSGWDTSAVTNFENMFSIAQAFNGDISNWDTGSAINMRNMFNNSAFNQNISNWDTHNLVYMAGMFASSRFNNGSTQNDSANPLLTEGNKWDLSNVQEMNSLFEGSSFNQDVSNWDVSNVTNFNRAFASDQNFDQDISDWDPSAGRDFALMFHNDYFNNHGQPLAATTRGWNLTSATNLEGMFQSNRAFNQDISSWDLSNVTNLNSMFYDSSAFNNGGVPLTWDTSNIQSMENTFAWARAFNADISSWNMSNVISTAQMFYGSQAFQGNINTWDMSKDTNMNNMFSNSNFNQDISAWDTSNVHYMAYMFNSNWSFDQDISSWNTANVYDMSGMFQSTNFNQPLNSWNVGNVTNMNSMFSNTQRFNQPLADWDVSSVQYMASMFQSSRAFNQPLKNWNLQNAYTTDHMFCDAIFNEDISNWNTSHVENMSGMFQSNTVFNQDITAWDVSHVRNFDAMFYYAMKFNQPVGVWDVSSAVSTGNMFVGGIFNQPLNDWNVSKLETTYNMFQNNLVFNQDLDKWDTSNLNNAQSMFQNATSFNGDITTWDTSRLNTVYYMFDGATVFNQDISNWDVSHVNNFEAMFQNAKAFNQPIGKWNVSNIWNGNRFFFGASAFNQDLSNWNTGKLTYAWGMFYEAYAFNGDVSTWDTHSLQQIQWMFGHDHRFNQDLSGWNFSNVYWADNAFDYTGIRKLNYAKLLISLDGQNLHQVTIGLEGVRYLDIAAAARENLATPVELGGKGWYIHDAGQFSWSLVTVNKKPDAADIKIGQTLADSSLSGANTNVSGTWSFTDPTVSPTAEDQDVSVTFTPDDEENYEPIVRAVNVHVLYEPRTISFTGTNSANWVKGSYDASVETSFGGGTVTYSVLTGSCSIDQNGVLTAIENGTCTFRATVANDGIYEAVSVDGTATLRTYLVTFGSNSGSSVASQHLDVSGTLSAPADPTRAGYTFLGWSETDGGAAVSFPYTPDITNDITLYALWSADKHVVTFDSKSGSAVSDASFVTDGSLAIPFDPTRTGYSFLGWSDSDGGESITFPYAPDSLTDVTLYALWSADKHVVTFDSKNGSAVSAGSFVTDGSVAAPVDPTRTGYSFVGWSATDGGSTISFPYSPGVISDITLYAKWSVKPYLVKYNSMGGSAVADGLFTSGNAVGEKYHLLDNGFIGSSSTVSGLELGLKMSTSAEGWVTKVTFYKYEGDNNGHTANVWSSDRTLLASQEFVNETASGWQTVILEHPVHIDANTTFVVSVFSATYSFNGSPVNWLPSKTSGPLTIINGVYRYALSPTYPYNSVGSQYNVNLEFSSGAALAPTPTRSGYTFLGWSATDGGSAVSFPYTPGVAQDITLYALWSADSHTVNLGANGGSVTFVTGGSIDAPAAPVRAGYSFEGWSLTDGGSALDFPYAPGVATDITLYALWSADSHVVTFNSKSGSAVADDSFLTDGSLAIPFDPSRAGYTFLGWSATDGGSTVTFPYAPGVITNITLYALWSADSHLVSFNHQGGSLVTPGLFVTDGTVAAPAPTTRAGYTFLGWSATDGGSAVTFPYAPGVITDITMYALWSADSHTVTFNSKSETAVSAGSFETAGAIQPVLDPTRAGYTFAGWSATDGGAALTFPYTPGVTTGITLYALWTVGGYVVTFDSHSGTAVSAGSFVTGGSVSAPAAPTRVGYTFQGWSATDGGSAVSFPYSPGVLRDVTLFAKWSADSHVVTFNSKSGTAVSSGSFVTDGTIAAPSSPTRGGYSFTGWSDTDGGSAVTFPYASGATTNITLYALWSAGSHTVAFNSKGGSAVSSGSFTTGGDIAIPYDPTREGYSFLGWSATDGGSVLTFPYTPSVATNITLFAKWSADSHVVTFDSKSGTAVAPGSFYTAGTVSAPAAPTRVGYTFLGWSATDGGSAVSFPYTPGVAQDITLYALWSADSHTVTFNSKSGSAVSAGSFVTGGTVSAPAATTRLGYTFAGWSATDGGDAVSFPYSSPATTNITLYALWSADSHVVTYNSKGGSVVSAGSFVTAGSLAIPYDPTRDGYSFLGWSATDGGTAVTFPYAPGVLTNITLFAKWSADSHVVTFDTKSGTAVVSGSFVTAGSVATAPSAPTRDGYIFTGWSATDGGSAVTFPYTPGVITDVTLYALWTAVTAPSAPLNVSATAGNATATVTWSAPASTGGANITSYLVTASTGQTCETVTRTCTFTGLPNKTAVTFTVVAINSVGAGAATAPTASVTPIDPNDDVLPPEGDGGSGPKEIPTDGKFVASNDKTFQLAWDKKNGKLTSRATGIYTGYIQAVATFTVAGKTYSCSTVFGTLKAMPMKTAAQKAASMKSKTFTGKQFCIDKIKMDVKTLTPKGGMTAANFKKIKSMKKTAADLAKEKLALAALKNFTGEVSIQVTRYRAWPTTMVNIGDHNSKGGKIPFLIRNTNVVLK